MTDNQPQPIERGEREQAVAAALAAIEALAEPADNAPAQALWALTEIIGTVRAVLRPYAETLISGLEGAAADRLVADRLYQVELALDIAAEHAESGGTTPAQARPEATEPAPRYIGPARIAKHFGVANNTVSGWLAQYPADHPTQPTPMPDAYVIEYGRARALWAEGDWAAWDAWKDAKDAAAAYPTRVGDGTADTSGPEA